MRVRTTYRMLQKQHDQALAAQSMANWTVELEQVIQTVDDLLSSDTIRENTDTVNKLQKIESFLKSL